MIKINCNLDSKMKLVNMIPFQGELKKRTQQNLDTLKESLKTEGLLMPFAIWSHDGQNMLLDGHGRREALIQLALEDVGILDVEWPVIFIDAENEEEARKALLQITSQYGKVTKAGVKQFTATIPDYVAPSIKKYVASNKNAVKSPVNNTSTIIKVRVTNDKIDEFKDIISRCVFTELV